MGAESSETTNDEEGGARGTEAVPDRRPIKSRGWGVFVRLASRLSAAGVSPNAISLSSIVFGCLAGLAFAATSRVEGLLPERLLWLVAGVGIQLRLIANLLDGMVAIEGGKKSAVGPLFNEAPDRVADAAIMLGAGWAAGGNPALGAAATIVALFVAYVRALGASVGAGQAFHGPMAKPQRMALLTFVAAYGAIAPAGWRPEAHGALGLAGWALVVIVVGGVVTATRRIAEISRRLRAAECPGTHEAGQ